jgi:Short C-terminal domain
MVVIFGFGAGSPEDLGAVAPAVCPNCHNQVFFHHVRSKKSVRLYFVPVVPYGTDDYLVCPVCSRGLQVSHAQLPHLRTMAAAATSFRTGRLSQAQYQAQVEGFWRQFGVNPAGQQLFAAPGPGGQAPGPTAAAAAAAAAAAPAAGGSEPPWISHLRQLAQLHDQGVLSDADFEAAKQRVLEQEQQG